jgi:Na+-driven multidrug efflux pump
MTAAGVAIFIAARPIAELFVDDHAVVDNAVIFIQVLAAAQPLMAIDFTLGGALRGAGDTRFPLFAVLIGFYLCRLGGAYAATFVFKLPLVWLWLALLPDYIARCLLKGWRFNSGRWKTIRI